jgi:ligand-binding sensor domain-containing protein
VSNIQSGPDGALWFATNGGLYRYEEQTFATYTAGTVCWQRIPRQW